MTKEEKMKKHVRLARKHINEIEKLGYVVAVGHSELNVYDYSDAPPIEERNKNKGTGFAPEFWSPEDQVVETIS